ncbi:hypothetical protein [Chryseobacterium sp. JK1]
MSNEENDEGLGGSDSKEDDNFTDYKFEDGIYSITFDGEDEKTYQI